MNENNLKKGEKTAQKAFFLESFLASAKTIIGIFTQSSVLTSDALHSLSDLLPISASWLGLKIAQKKADKKFSYGYYKAENVATLIVSAVIIFTSYRVFRNSFSLFEQTSTLNTPLLALSISFIDALVLFFFGKYEIKIGKQINSESLIAMGKENRTHILTSGAVFLGTLASWKSIPYVEAIVTIIISFLILEIGITSGKKALLILMDISPGEKFENKIIKTITSISGIEDFSNLKLRKSGPYIIGEVKVAVRKDLDVQQSHALTDKIENRLQKKVPQIDSFTIHVEPFKSKYRHLVIPVKDKNGLNSEISPKFGRSKYFLFVNLKKRKIKGYYFIENKYKKENSKTGLKAVKIINKQKSDTVLTKKIGEISFYALKDNLFDIYQTQSKTAQQAVNNFLKNKLQKINSPVKVV